MRILKKVLPFLFLAAVAAVILVCRMIGRADLRRLRQEVYNAAFFSMIPYRDAEAVAVGGEVYTYYMGVDTVTASRYLRSENQVNDYLEAVFDSGNEISTVCLELLPAKLGGAEKLIGQIAAHPETTFRILLGAPSLDYWLSQSGKRTEKQLAAYQALAEKLMLYGNVRLFFAGAEDWLVMNPGNYVAPWETNRDVSWRLAVLTFCCDGYLLYPENATAVFDALKYKIEMAKEESSGVDLSGWCLVFFGDSLIGNYSDSLSIPCAVSALSGCQAYNLGVGGSTAVRHEQPEHCFGGVLDCFLSLDRTALEENAAFQRNMSAFCDEDHAGKQLCFILHFGVNDYFDGQPLENEDDPFDCTSYAGALRSGIEKLQAAYPEAVIILSSPVYTSYFSYGQEILGDAGGRLTDYVDAAAQVAEDTGVIFMNNYEDLGVDASNVASFNISDGVHLEDAGRFLYAQSLVRLIEDSCLTEGP